MALASWGSITAPLCARTPAQPVSSAAVMTASAALETFMCCRTSLHPDLPAERSASICWPNAEAQASIIFSPNLTHMLRSLLPALTAPNAAMDLFAAVTREARAKHWYVEGQVPDTLEGRFAVLATIAALTILRLERAGERGVAASVALTERFVEVMESEHREMGLGDPKLGRTVRKLVSGVARRVEMWRGAAGGDWAQTARASVYGGEVGRGVLDHSAAALRSFWSRIERLPDQALIEGRLS